MNNKVKEIRISYREKIRTTESTPIKSSNDAGKLFYDTWNKDSIGVQETFKVLLLNNANKVKGIYQLSTGSITGTLVDMRILFAVILKTLATSCLLCHNHPSHKLKPSQADLQLTEKIKKAAQLFDINILDHLILAPNGEYYSFADNGDL